jgi:hypothetical protein
MTKPNQVLAVSNIDFYTAKHLLSEDVTHFVGETTPEFNIDPNETLLLQSRKLLFRLRNCLGTNVIAIICMPEGLARLQNIPVLDHKQHVNSIPSIDFEMLWDMQDDRPNDRGGLVIPVVNTNEMLIAKQVETFKREQIMSHVQTFIHATPRSSHEEVQNTILRWLGGEITTDKFYTTYKKRWAKADPKLDLLYEFMQSNRGKEYVEFFKKHFSGKPTPKTDIPPFDIAYFSKLREKMV